ncbi:ectoine synthase [Alicyclobacillus cycloheptanicus]|jgi:L-ectoine synthase|uniref:L-ectoine synthase n=1 Tax=Alicyclobacillus cycloheptanicus TaxID=1457 RepID=A0ABT9XHI5_9BACL|nr:ectoine synthase [Alicyclobacillus cycloheptanicus]MDQ0189750.1 L-ectoine synthase [Alicyclobacillus cycloheptanicus]WDM01957.1 ectoine synthase [Alicyclobacillus cycloheptanicus]
MIVRQLQDIQGTDRDVHAETWSSRRLILRDDNVGFSLHDTIMKAGTDTMMWYKNHIEAVYCIEGEGEIEDLQTGEVHSIRPGTMYLLNNHDQHRVRPKTDLRLVCVFNPPCTGREVHGPDGAYPLST